MEEDFLKTVYEAIQNNCYTTFDTLKYTYKALYEKQITLKAENEELKEERDDLYERCYKKANLSPDCNPYYCVLTLAKEISELKEKLKNTFKLPCKVGDTIYVVPSETNFCLNAMFGHKENNRIYEQIIESINFYKAGVYIVVTCDGLYTNHSKFLNENWFLTRELAENRLKELEGK